MTTIETWMEYKPQEFEPRLQRLWEEQGLYRAEESDKPKFYCLDFFPYPSGSGLHVGHCRNYIPTDVLSRYLRMKGFNVLHPMGWDAFGEPTEQHAVQHGTHPRETTDRNTENYRRQMTMIGTSYDWSREIDSSKPEFYKWTQWFFLMLYRRGLAYRDDSYQWWCPICQTTLSSSEAIGGVCWRGHTGLERRKIPSWYFRITEYADRLLDGLGEIDWPEPIKVMQRNWIGRSEGVEIDFTVVDGPAEGERIPAYTTRADTLFGVSFFLLAPEHPLALRIAKKERTTEVKQYIHEASRQTELERMAESRPKTGVFTGANVRIPLSGEEVPVWVADFVLPGYGTGAVMGVPAHDERDYAFARLYDLPVQPVIKPVGEQVWGAAFTGEGVMVNSGNYSGFTSQEGRRRIQEDLQQSGLGMPRVNYRMHDWLISRQRYWGTPIPIVYCPECGEQPVPEDDLPVLLPDLEDFSPDGSGRSPLAKSEEFVKATCPNCGGPAERETDTMGGFACSSWYFLRFTSPHYHQGPFDPEAVRYWMPVDLYVGGAEHAVLHLLYARFWTHVMADEGLITMREPFTKLLNQGQLLGEDGQRMSKSRGNVIIPDDVVAEHGADTLRMYVMFMAPFDQDVNWSTEGIAGTSRFLKRVWDLYHLTHEESRAARGRDLDLDRATHRMVRGVEERIEELRFNTMISTLMEYTRMLTERHRDGSWETESFHEALETLLLVLAPAAPHIAEELWQRTGHGGSVHRQPWPSWDPDLARVEEVEIAVQVDNRVRDTIVAPRDAGQVMVEEMALARENIQRFLAGRQVVRTYYAPGRLINFVSRPVERH